MLIRRIYRNFFDCVICLNVNWALDDWFVSARLSIRTMFGICGRANAEEKHARSFGRHGHCTVKSWAVRSITSLSVEDIDIPNLARLCVHKSEPISLVFHIFISPNRLLYLYEPDVGKTVHMTAVTSPSEGLLVLALINALSHHVTLPILKL